MNLQFSVLASGSTGNSFFIGNEKTQFLVDAGLSAKGLEEQLIKIDRNIKDIDGILITHEHIDHVKGIGVIARKHNIPIYANEKTWKSIGESLGKIPLECRNLFEVEDNKVLEGLGIESFATSHDAAEPMGYVFHNNGKKLVYITDTGYVSQRVKSIIKDADIYIFESNHDVSMLQMCQYPWHIKRRILSDVGHVSNEDAAIALSEVITDRTNRIYLAHLSQDNNLKEIAKMVCTQILEERGHIIGDKLQIHDTDPKTPTELVLI
jgi:phosphoribosyl 1,2-cyclic phosphodiesterase